MITRQQFIEQEIQPTLGDYADCYDMDAIADEVSDYDPPRRLRMETGI